MAKAKSGDTVKVHYTGSLDDGAVFDSSREREPLEVTLGRGQLIAGFENALMDMAPGESKTVVIPANDAYGEYHPELVFTAPLDRFPPDVKPEVGMMLGVRTEQGPCRVVVKEITDQAVTLDGNHPLAGQTLTFHIELLHIS